MKSLTLFPLKLTTLVLVPAAVLAFASCSTEPKDTAVSNAGAVPSAITNPPPPITVTSEGAAVIETFTATATVAAVDPVTRKVTLTAPDGRQTTYKASPDVVNFDQIRVGDKVNAVVTEEFAVFLRKKGLPPNDGEAALVALAPKGAKPGILLAEAREVTARITSIDPAARLVTLQFVEGGPKTIRVGPKVNLAGVMVGDDVTVRVSEALAVVVTKP